MKPFVRVIWHDAEDFKDATWASEEELQEFTKEPCVVESFGYLVSKTRKALTLAADLAEPVTFGRSIKIPRKMIVSTSEISLPPISAEKAKASSDGKPEENQEKPRPLPSVRKPQPDDSEDCDY